MQSQPLRDWDRKVAFVTSLGYEGHLTSQTREGRQQQQTESGAPQVHPQETHNAEEPGVSFF